MMGGLTGSTRVDLSAPMSPRLTTQFPEISHPTRSYARVFFSGHSLIDNPLPDFVAAIAQGGNTPIEWNQQNLEGSSIEARTRGDGNHNDLRTWSGYRSGRDRDGNPVDVLAEVRTPEARGLRAYDVLIITENHALLDHVVWFDTVRYLRHYHEQFSKSDPRATTYLFESWISLNSKTDPKAWIAYEKAASPAWACLASRINHSLKSEGRRDRIVPLPAGHALAQLVERATSGGGLSGLTEATIEQTLSRLFLDEVHLTPLGSYYVALVTYAVVFGRSPSGTWQPPDVDPSLAATLQAIASQFAADHRSTSSTLPIDDCKRYMQKFVGIYLEYQRNAGWLGTTSPSNFIRWLRFNISWRFLFSRDNARNPLHYDIAQDSAYWVE